MYIIRKHFWVIPTVSLLAMTFFVTRGVFLLQSEPSPRQLVEQSSSAQPIPQLPVKPPPKSQSRPMPEKDTKTILDRNIFDSVTGSVLHSPSPISGTESEKREEVDVTDLIRCPGAEEIKLEATISDEGNTGGSFATVNLDGTRSQLFIGDQLLNRKVIAITWRYLILQGTGDVCYLDMF